MTWVLFELLRYRQMSEKYNTWQVGKLHVSNMCNSFIAVTIMLSYFSALVESRAVVIYSNFYITINTYLHIIYSESLLYRFNILKTSVYISEVFFCYSKITCLVS